MYGPDHGGEVPLTLSVRAIADSLLGTRNQTPHILRTVLTVWSAASCSEKVQNYISNPYIVNDCGSGGCLGSAAEWVERGCGSGNGV